MTTEYLNAAATMAAAHKQTAVLQLIRHKMPHEVFAPLKDLLKESAEADNWPAIIDSENKGSKFREPESYLGYLALWIAANEEIKDEDPWEKVERALDLLGTLSWVAKIGNPSHRDYALTELNHVLLLAPKSERNEA